MPEFIKKSYGFTDYQMAQLRFFFLSMLSELSKLFLIGLCFLDVFGLFVWALFIFQLLRASCGGLHCRTYRGCFAVSLGYMVLAIRILPLFSTDKLWQMITLLVCIIITYHIGPLTSVFHPVLTDSVNTRLRHKSFFIIFLYLVVLYILPENPYSAVGYWVIILNTCQLVLAKLLKKEGFS